MGLTGDVYMVGHFIESQESHKRLIPNSTATTIEQAEEERILYEDELERQKALATQSSDEEPGWEGGV